MLATVGTPPAPATTFFSVPPTANMQAWGGLMPNMPRLETVMVPPWNSCGCNFPSLALPAISRTLVEISERPLPSAPVTMGVINPLPVSTATDTSHVLNCLMKVSIQALLHSGTLLQDRATALIMKSFTDSFTPSFS